MRLILDSDALIKLNRAGALGRVVQCFDCVVPDKVLEEVVVRGQQLGYPDAAEIREALKGSATVEVTSSEPGITRGLGRGESAVAEVADRTADAVVVSDDGQFLSLMERRGVALLSPAAVLVTLVEEGHFSVAEALTTLDRMGPSIRSHVYGVIKNKLEEISGHGKD